MSKSKANVPSNLAGWFFLVLEGPQVKLHAQVARTYGGDHHLLQLLGPAPSFQMVTSDDLTQGVLFPNTELRDKWVAGYMQQFQAPPEAQDQAETPGEGQSGSEDGINTAESAAVDAQRQATA